MMKLLVLLAVCALGHVSQSFAAISNDEFIRAVTSNGAPPPAGDIYPHFSQQTNSFSREELAMFLAQLIHESGGFRYREEIACTTGNHCAGQYVDNVGLPGKNYYGRGFIQLTWGANYKAASQALGMGDRLLQNPEIVASDTKIAVQVSVWYWTSRVRPSLAGRPNQFGVTTKAINGAIECSGGPNQQAKNRYQIYLKVAAAMNIQNKAVENGCYN